MNSESPLRNELIAILQDSWQGPPLDFSSDQIQLKSLNILLLVTTIEKKMGIKFTFEEITSANFQTFSGILKILETKRASRP